MKKLFLIGAALLAFASCSKDKDKPRTEGNEYEISLQPNSNEPWEWAFVTLADGRVVTESDAWDIAILRYSRAEMAIRTPFDTDTHPIKYMVTGPGGAGYGTREDVVWSGVKALDFKPDPSDPEKFVMPPVYLQLPAHDFLSSDKKHTYRVQFTGYDYRSGILVMTVQEI